jgi:hypothetical protein
VVASDVAAAACDDARAARVSGQRVALLPRALASSLSPSAGGHAVDTRLLAHLRVARGDLRLHTPAGPFDLVVCRDVLHHFRPDIALQMLGRLADSLDDAGVLVVSVVDALATGLAIDDDGDGVVVVDRALVAVDHDAPGGRAVAGFRPAIWTLCGLLDGDANTRDRTARLLSLAGDVEGADVAAAASLVAEGRLDDARAAAGDGEDGRLVKAVCDARLGRLSEARASLEGLRTRSPSSWLCAWLLAELAGRTGRAAEARGLLRNTLELLEGAGAPAGELVALLPELHPRHVGRACRQTLEGQRGLWHRP